MIRNKRGMTLIELLVTIVLVGIVLIFIFRLLLDLRGQRDVHNFSYDNQINRTESLYRIYNDLTNHTLSKISKVNDQGKLLNLKFEYLDSSVGNISVTTSNDKYFLHYTFKNSNDEENTYTWEMIDSVLDVNCLNFDYGTDENNMYFVLRINIYNDHETNMNALNNIIIDDIEISYYGPTFEISNNLLNIECNIDENSNNNNNNNNIQDDNNDDDLGDDDTTNDDDNTDDDSNNGWNHGNMDFNFEEVESIPIKTILNLASMKCENLCSNFDDIKNNIHKKHLDDPIGILCTEHPEITIDINFWRVPNLNSDSCSMIYYNIYSAPDIDKPIDPNKPVTY